MIKRILVIIILTVISVTPVLLAITIDSSGSADHFSRAKNGIMDLSEWNVQKDPILPLNGEWEFYWNQLLTPSDFHPAGGTAPELTGFLRVPSLWSGKEFGGKVLPVFGCATYRLVLKNTPYCGVLGLKKANVRFSSKVYVNGQELFADGKPAKDAASYESGNNPKFGFYYCDGSNMEIIVQASNFDYIDSGIPSSFLMGEQSAMLKLQRKSELPGFSVLVTLLTIALLYFIFYICARICGRKASSLLAFAVFCFIIAIGNALTDQRPLVLLLPHISFESIFKMKDFFLSASLIAVTSVFYHTRRGIVSLRMFQIVSAIYCCHMLAVLLLPIYLYCKIYPLIMVINTVLLGTLLTKTMILFIRCKQSEMLDYLLLFIAILAINLYSVDCILFTGSLLEDPFLSQVYLILFAVMMIFLLSMHYYKALSNLKVSMKRTRNAEIAFLRSQIKPHFLFNTLNSIAALCKAAPDKAEDVTIQLSEYLRGSFDFKTLDSLSTVKKEMELMEAYLNIEKVRFGKRLTVEYDIDKTIDIPIPPLILQPLVENAVRHGLMTCVNGGTVKVSIRKIQSNAAFSIEDNGTGMEPSQLERIFLQVSGRSGVGLWNISQRLRLIYGIQLEIWSEKGAGTKVSFQIPINFKDAPLSDFLTNEADWASVAE